MYLSRYTWNACQYCTNLHISQCVIYIVMENTFQNSFFSPLLCPTIYCRIGIKIRINTEAELSGGFVRSDITSFNCLSTLISLCSESREEKGRHGGGIVVRFTLTQKFGCMWFIWEVILRMMEVGGLGK